MIMILSVFISLDESSADTVFNLFICWFSKSVHILTRMMKDCQGQENCS